ncbi:MAG: diaminopimelate dehydrogenase [Alcaligenaceae bacterium]|nr:diaminopimelate dehydrogenase [Alcaligenaceae bacterium]
MTQSIRIGIVGYGNLGRGVETAIRHNPDMSLVGVFTRRAPDQLVTVDEQTAVFAMADLPTFQDKIDVLILCGGSKDDLPKQTPEYAALFNTVDSFDTHAKIPEFYATVDAAAAPAKKTALISVGWDPGLFSLNRLYAEAVLPDGETYTFWGKGLSQGHSDAVRRVEGVKAGVQYTIPSEQAMTEVRSGARPTLDTRQKHTRECYVVLDQGADAAQVEQSIKTMPNYFDEYDTTVHFIDEATLQREHRNMPHGGFVIRSGNTRAEHNQVIEYGLQLGDNPGFTSSVLVAYARAAYRMNQQGVYGAKTVFDVAPGLLSIKSPEQLRKEML